MMAKKAQEEHAANAEGEDGETTEGIWACHIFPVVKRRYVYPFCCVTPWSAQISIVLFGEIIFVPFNGKDYTFSTVSWTVFFHVVPLDLSYGF